MRNKNKDAVQRESFKHIRDAQTRLMSLETKEYPAASSLVHTTGNETIAGVKTFSNGIAFANETLSTYDEGTWTPAITADVPGTMAVTYTLQNGKYTRIGNIVFYHFFIRIATYSAGTATGNIRISLPITAAERGVGTIFAAGIDWPGTPISVGFFINASTTYGNLAAIQDNAAIQYVGVAALAATDDISVSGFYHV